MLNLSPQQTVLDMPCGQGGVSVHLAKEYGVTVDGYDLLPGFIDNANEYAAEQNVQSLCSFSTKDIREVIEKGKQYDVVLWSAAPHLWDNYAQTIKNLRKCVKHKGYIVIADAYLYSDDYKHIEPDYETLEDTLKSVTAYGDILIKHIDYKDTLWTNNYRTDREAVARTIENANNEAEKAVLQKHLDNITESEKTDSGCMGLYILVLQVEK